MLEGVIDAVAHFDGGFEGCFFAAVLPVGEIFGELVPLAADAEAPALEGGCFVGVAGDVALGHRVLVLSVMASLPVGEAASLQ